MRPGKKAATNDHSTCRSGSLMRKWQSGLLMVASLIVSGRASAHHGGAAYDSSKELVLNAIVQKFVWANPHCLISFDVKDEGGEVVHWATELSSPSALSLVGWTRTTLQPGDKITIYIHQAKTGRPVGRMSHVVLADGTTLKDG